MATKLIVLSIGRDIITSAERMIGKKADAVIEVQRDCSPELYPKIRKEVYGYLKKWQEFSLELILSGPLALSFTIGQLVGLNHFDISVYQYDSEQKQYIPVPMPERNETYNT